ncbi:hypothetical protein FB45DRAFT_901565 [Roridomyces roridus]|uniref:Ubiquitin carboxyl-terminal hydrolase n=1 Tax=Roridomyces roridus TaxID=1738132 RepID=A0AAD7FTE5_9AGAR|nr:hypothetical protein FB45DRAFT_901565 [Roridomyces roridus]
MANHYQGGPGPSNYYIQQAQSPPPPPGPGPNYAYPPAGAPNGYPYAYPRVPQGNGNGNGHGNGTPPPPFRPPYVGPPYAHQMQPKYPQAYQYNPYAPVWHPQQQQQQLSPLPKDDVPLTSTPGYYAQDPQIQHVQHQNAIPLTQPQPQLPPPAGLHRDFGIVEATSPTGTTTSSPKPTSLPVASSSSSRPSSPARAESLLITPPASRSPSRTRGTSRPRAQSPLSPSLASSRPTSPSPLSPHFSPRSHVEQRGRGGNWTISRFRPRDPALAPGVMISPLARPPAVVVESAAEGGWDEPPVEEEPVAKVVRKKSLVVDEEVAPVVVPVQEEEFKVEAEVVEAVEAVPALVHEAEPSTTSSSSPSITAATPDGVSTPTTAATTVPGSPKAVSTPPPPAPATTTPAPAAASTSTSTSAPTPAPAPAKKSWASLLRASAPASSSSSSSPASPSSASSSQPRRALPTSSVVGFSVPASATPQQIQADLEYAKRRAEVAKLLAAATPSSTSGEGMAVGKLSPRGLINTGNMCFANAVLQALVYCQPFAGLFLRLRGLLEGFAPPSSTLGEGAEGAEMVRATGAFLAEFFGEEKKEKEKEAGSGNGNGKGKARAEGEEEDEGEAFIPTGVYDALKGKKRFDGMRGGQQEDAEEFLGFYLDTLEEELIALAGAVGSSSSSTAAASSGAGVGGGSVDGGQEEVEAEPEGDGWLEVGRKNRGVVMRTIKAAESPITRIFGGTFRSTLRSPGQKDSVIVEGWTALRLDIQRDQIHTVEDALTFLAHPQSVQLTRPSGAPALDASQQVLIDTLPPVLILHMKRFCYDTNVGGVVKVGKRVEFGEELVIGKEVLAGSGRKGVRYKLFAVIYHHGISAGGGHYTLDVLHPARGWVRIDDELVSDVRAEDVFGSGAGGGERCAYLLFYRRVR